MSAVRAMQEWCRLQCEGYPGVHIHDFSSSFRDGLAFCALIHRHRPDLIDFDSLYKENIYDNNRLAFEVAEQELGIPALLDPTDMVSMKVPDRLSILTYLSQYYNYFRNLPPAGEPHPPAIKRSAASSSSEPSLKKTVEKTSTPQSEEEVCEPSLQNSMSSSCASCHQHVHLVQRYLVDGQLYHRQCFRCKECCSTLLSGSYRLGPESGTFVCTHHRGRAISPSASASHQDSMLSGWKLASAKEQGEGGLDGSLAKGKSITGSLPMPERDSEGHGSLLEATATCRSDGNEAPSLTAVAFNSNLPAELKVQGSTVLRMYSDAPVDTVPKELHLAQVPNELTVPAKIRPQIQPKPALPSKPASLRDQTAIATHINDPGSPCILKPLQDQNGTTQSGDFRGPCTSTSEEDQTSASSLSDDHWGKRDSDILEDQTTAAYLSCNPTELPTLLFPQDQLGASSSGNSDLQVSHTPGTLSSAGDRDGKPVPAARQAAGATMSPQTVPVPKPRSTLSGDTGSESGMFTAMPVINGVQPKSSPPVPKPRARPNSSERMENGKPHKEPPWIALVQTEKRRKSAPPPPRTPPRLLTEEQLSGLAQDREGQLSSRKPLVVPKPYNPFEDEEEEEEEASESFLAPGHPWYGITPTSSPKAKKRVAPKAPSSSPLARHSSLLSASRASHSEPSSCTPSPALSIESLISDPSLSETVSKSSSEPTVHAVVLCPSNGGPAPASLSASELANHGMALAASHQSSQSSSSRSLKSSPHRPPPPTPTMPPTGEANTSAPSPPLKTQPKSSCKENPFNRKASPVDSPILRKSTKGPKPARPPAPGHGFPLVKRKVQADQYIPEEDIHGELNAIEQQLDEMELRGIELEGKLRSVNSETEDDNELLVDWFRLIHEKHMLVRRESELVYVIKQQNLEQRQADVEYELRCLLNKPEKDWTEDDRAREQVLMQELVTIIEQRNAIVTCLDEDRQREEEEDQLVAAMIKRKDFQKDPESSMTKKKGKFKPLKALKRLSAKPDQKTKSPNDKS